MEGDCTIVTNRDTRITISAADMRVLLRAYCETTVTRTGRMRSRLKKNAPAAPTAGGNQSNPTAKKENN